MARTKEHGRTYITQQDRWTIWETSGKRCAHCGKPMINMSGLTVDHVIPLSKGGTNDIKNLVALCYDCNQEKNNDIIDPAKYYKKLPPARMKEVRGLFQDYLDSTDWLDWNTLFKLDRFEEKFFIYRYDRKSDQYKREEKKVSIKKMLPEEVIAFFDSLDITPVERTHLPKIEEEVATDHYKFEYNNEIKFVTSCYLRQHTGDGRIVMTIECYSPEKLNNHMTPNLPNSKKIFLALQWIMIAHSHVCMTMYHSNHADNTQKTVTQMAFMWLPSDTIIRHAMEQYHDITLQSPMGFKKNPSFKIGCITDENNNPVMCAMPVVMAPQHLCESSDIMTNPMPYFKRQAVLKQRLSDSPLPEI